MKKLVPDVKVIYGGARFVCIYSLRKLVAADVVNINPKEHLTHFLNGSETDYRT